MSGGSASSVYGRRHLQLRLYWSHLTDGLKPPNANTKLYLAGHRKPLENPYPRDGVECGKSSEQIRKITVRLAIFVVDFVAWLVGNFKRKCRRYNCPPPDRCWYNAQAVQSSISFRLKAARQPSMVLASAMEARAIIDGLVDTKSLCGLKEAVDSGMADAPFKDIQDVPLCLYNHLLVIQRAALGMQLFNHGHAVLLVTVLGGDEQ
ncbi:hypothetical protein V496_00072 [Pseudogymnoascus sp. VKM F-4515 (FW-2607)]|nr:hypothetical protein V496_00072 [Pseudogymnoascus sp. VKM F-4515 (FW-2607)]